MMAESGRGPRYGELKLQHPKRAGRLKLRPTRRAVSARGYGTAEVVP